MFDPVPQLAERTARAQAVQARLAELQGIINAAEGEMAAVVAGAIADDVCSGPGVETPAKFLAWRTGVSSTRARNIVALAERLDEVPTCAAAVRAGALTLDQAALIARHVPTSHEASATEVAKCMTVRQLRRALPKYGYEPPRPKDDAADPDAPPPPPPEPERWVSSGEDERGWWMKIRLSVDEGAVVDRGMAAMREDLFRAASQRLPNGRTPEISDADALVCMAEAALRAGEAAHPGSDRYLVHLHLEESPDGSTPSVLSQHLGARLPEHVHRLLLCDCSLRGVRERHGSPVDVGRKTRVISRRLRRLIEHRDGGCKVPGCGNTRGLDIHHIQHWEDLGPTDTHNLVALCRRHHRLHHSGHLGIEGNADLPSDAAGALAFTDQSGHLIPPSAEPVMVDPEVDVAKVAAERDAAPTEAFSPPTGERLRWQDFYLQPAAPPRAGPAPADAA